MAAKPKPSLSIQVETNDDEENSFSYCDFMMLGRTGLGKSTVGNKLLGIDPETTKPYKDDTEIKQFGYDGDEEYFFETGDGTESVTRKCKVLCNDTVRVMDTVGFADTKMTKKFGVIQGNLQAFRWILQAQKAYDMRFTRVLYFFPQRGYAERAEGTLQEEIKLMHDFFGQKIFDVMVIVVTHQKRELFQKAGFSEEDIAGIREVFQKAYESVVPEESREASRFPNAPMCPPVVFIPVQMHHESVFSLINGAVVISDAEVLAFSPEYPTNPELRGNDILKFSVKHEEASRFCRGQRLSFEDRCTRCAVKLVYEKLETGEVVPVAVVYPNGDQDFYDHSFCHPLFIPRYTKVQRFFGGVAHILTFGIGKLYEYASKQHTWPSFTSAEEECIKCNKQPGAPSCHPVKQHYEIAGEMQMIDHTREIDIVKHLEDTEEKNKTEIN